MARPRKADAKPIRTLEQTLWDAADKMRGNLESSEYKHVALGLVFLEYVSDAFEQRHQFLEAATADPDSDGLRSTSGNGPGADGYGRLHQSCGSPTVHSSDDRSNSPSGRGAPRPRRSRMAPSSRVAFTPPDEEERAIELVLEQAQLLATEAA